MLRVWAKVRTQAFKASLSSGGCMLVHGEGFFNFQMQLRWLLDEIRRDWPELSLRQERDLAQHEAAEAEARAAKRERVRLKREAREHAEEQARQLADNQPGMQPEGHPLTDAMETNTLPGQVEDHDGVDQTPTGDRQAVNPITDMVADCSSATKSHCCNM